MALDANTNTKENRKPLGSIYGQRETARGSDYLAHSTRPSTSVAAVRLAHHPVDPCSVERIAKTQTSIDGPRQDPQSRSQDSAARP